MKINRKLAVLGAGILTSTGALAQTFYQCMPCSAGTYSSGGKCVACPKGSYSVGGTNSCTQCQPGQYQDKTGQSFCKTCPAGSYCSSSGMSSPTKCPMGTYSTIAGATSSSTCLACPDYYWSDAGSTKCGKIQIRIYLSYWYKGTNTCTESSYLWMDASEKEEGTLCRARCSGNWCGWEGGDPAPGKSPKGCGRACGHWIGQESNNGKDKAESFDCKKLPCTGTGAYGTKETYTYPDKAGDVRIVY